MRPSGISVLLALLLISCANQSSPTGGPQDKKPPLLLNSNPKTNQRNYSGTTFELQFNEPVQLKNASEEVLITPSLGKKTKIVAKKNRVIVSPELSLAPNTTYTINFRDAVQDLNEGNPVYNLRLAFSTGPHIDSLQIYGTVTELFQEPIPTKITVAIYERDTFDIFRHTPTYFTRTDNRGRFNITNLRHGEYHIYAFDDKNKNLKVDSKTERFGFLSSKLFLNEKNLDSARLALVRVDARPLKLTSVRNTDRQSKLRFNKALDTVRLESDHYRLTYQYGSAQDEVLINNPPKQDSVQIRIYAKDSVGHTIDTTAFIKTTDTKLPKERFIVNFGQPRYSTDQKTMIITAKYNKPISKITLDSLYIQLDSTHFLPIRASEVAIDTLHHLLRLKKTFNPATASTQGKKPPIPILVAGKGSFISGDGDSTKSHTAAIDILSRDETGALSISVHTSQPNYIVQLVNGKGEIVRSLTNPRNHTFQYLPPDEYKIRVITDRNGNGKWDAGNYYEHIEPEPVIYYRTIDRKNTTPIRANWEVGPLEIRL